MSEEFIFRLKTKSNIWGIFEFLMVLYSICSLSFIQICPYFTELQTHTCKVKLTHTYQLQLMQYETKIKTRRGKTTKLKMKSS